MWNLKSSHMQKGYLHLTIALTEGTFAKLVKGSPSTRSIFRVSGYRVECMFQQEEGSSRNRQTPSCSSLDIFSDSRIGQKIHQRGHHLERTLPLSINKDFKSGVAPPGIVFNGFHTDLSDSSISLQTKHI